MGGGNEYRGVCDKEWVIDERIHTRIRFNIAAGAPGEITVSILTEVVALCRGER
jgi:hypothetical protein